jgi:Holliday junction resolvasome RuvABC endonuclease subunit
MDKEKVLSGLEYIVFNIEMDTSGMEPPEEYVVGIDPSATSTGITVLGTSGYVKVYNIKPGKLRDSARLEYIYSQVRSVLNSVDDITNVCLESPSYGSMHKEFILGEVLGVIKLAVNSVKKATLHNVAPTQVKKFLASNSKASKEDMVKAAGKDGCPSVQQDICDSWGLAKIALSINNGSSCIRTREAAEVVAALTTDKST